MDARLEAKRESAAYAAAGGFTTNTAAVSRGVAKKDSILDNSSIDVDGMG
eukprot:CAMPEP_0185584006 /NCGR_PEP_ID=MMETSP0434-20130131/29673_1 /TAXON_ID=626734 ORGANISM="Favella taraikaensis, Strain Fe Narragansett Bay" /NCGR_SAMPLE_ID=MMETSP0434 /ASSEMBLY_ACC=CAM_ASM_000379 /LENGTH=49 /DNA_ID= /DNA_START= /DNA_END= /DNA_ORIENTATION=